MRIGPLPTFSTKEISGMADDAAAQTGGAKGAAGAIDLSSFGSLGSLGTAGTSGINGTTDVGGLTGANGIMGLNRTTGASGTDSFSNLLSKAVTEIDGKMKTADAEKTKVLTGESTNLHQAVIAMQEASTAFSLMVEVRNKLVESYQEIMRMQV